MNRMKQHFYCALLAVMALCAATAAKAQSPFDGTWKTDLSQTKFSPKPLAFYISQGWYHCVTCNPTFDVAADGQDHAVTGQAYTQSALRSSIRTASRSRLRKAVNPITNRPVRSLPTARL
jgi:hypothetical protein